TATTPDRGEPPAASSSSTRRASAAGAAGYQRPARCGSLTDGTGPAITPWRSRRRVLLVAEGKPQALHVGAGEAGRAAHHLERVEQAAVRDRRLVVAAAHGRLARTPRVQDVVPDRVAGAGVAGALDRGAAPAAAERAALLRIHRPSCTEQSAAEAADSYRHRGVDPEGIARALVANLFHGHVVQGGSTITQQVVKALLLSPERSYERKLKELVLALRLEAKLSKDDILYLYLNQIYFGAGAYGVAAAAREFFDANVEDLTIAQAAVLAGLPQAPSRYDPQRHPQHAVARQHYVLQRMRENGFITPAQQTGALAEQLVFAPRRPATYLAAPWYVEHVRRLLEERYGGTRRLAPSAFKPGDVIAVTVTEEAVGGEARFALDQEPQVEGALAAIDPYTGQVKAMVGGYDFRRSQFNRAVQAKRQPGSAFKPLIYACAIDHGYTPASIVLDAPIVLPDGNRPPWMPRNYE